MHAAPLVKDAGSGRSKRAGFALEATLLLLVMFTIIVLAGLSAVTSLARSSDADYRGARASYAAEGAADDIMSQLDAKMQDGIINGSDIASLQTPALSGYRMTQTTATTGLPVSRTISSGPFSGLYSLNQPIDITVSARDSSGSRATAILSVNAQTIPLFQFGVFYENDLEILNGPAMTFAGWVHTNGNLYLSSNSTTYQSQITTPDSVFWNRKDSNNRLAGIFINNAAGTAVNLTFDSRSLSEAAFRTQSVSKFSSRLMTHAFGVKPLKLPLPTNMAPVTLVLPKDPADVQMVQDVKMAWKSDFYVTVKTGVFQIADTNTMKAAFCDSLVIERSAGLDVPSMGACRRIFKPRVNAFYEGREDLRPDLIDVHMDSLRIWSDSAPTTRSPRILYVAFSAPSISNASNDYVSVRLRGGAQLPKSRSAADTGGISVVTERPLYVLGDYNTTVWRPAALMADAISFLSNPPNPAMLNASPAASAVRCGTAGVTGWCDVMQQVMAQRTAKPTTVNAAILAGNSVTPCDYARAGCASPAYGGGLENFPRFLENWGGVTFTYTGSLVSLYTNRYSTGLWGNTTNVGYAAGGYYTPPTRNWAFDVNFRFPDRLPPGTPSVGTVLQTAFRPLY